MGKRASFGLVPAIKSGVTGAMTLVVLAITIQSINEMLRLAMRQRYDGPFEAVLSIARIGLDFAVQISTIEFWSTLVVGGLIVEAVWKRWG